MGSQNKWSQLAQKGLFKVKKMQLDPLQTVI